MKSYMAKKDEVSRRWFVVDAQGKVLGRLASRIAMVLRGKNKPVFTPFLDTGDLWWWSMPRRCTLTGRKAGPEDVLSPLRLPGRPQGNLGPAPVEEEARRRSCATRSGACSRKIALAGTVEEAQNLPGGRSPAPGPATGAPYLGGLMADARSIHAMRQAKNRHSPGLYAARQRPDHSEPAGIRRIFSPGDHPQPGAPAPDLVNAGPELDILVNVRGGGPEGQAGAMKHALSRALVALHPELRPILKKAGLLTRDPRIKERKKYGRRGARRGCQYSKRNLPDLFEGGPGITGEPPASLKKAPALPQPLQPL